MTTQVSRRSLERWLLANGFEQRNGRASGNHHFVGPHGVKVTVPGHGPADLTKKHVGMILRALEQAGYDRDQVRNELVR